MSEKKEHIEMKEVSREFLLEVKKIKENEELI